MKREEWLCWGSVRLAVGYVLAGPGLLETMLWQALFWQVRVALVHLEALSSNQFLKRGEWLCWSSVRLAVGHAFGWAGLLGAMMWLGRASLKPCFGKLCFGRFWGPFCLWRRFRPTNF